MDNAKSSYYDDIKVDQIWHPVAPPTLAPSHTPPRFTKFMRSPRHFWPLDVPAHCDAPPRIRCFIFFNYLCVKLNVDLIFIPFSTFFSNRKKNIAIE